MKVFENNKLYVQKKDISNLLNVISSLNMTMPEMVIKNVYNKNINYSGDEMYDFVEFSNKIEIDFFNSLDYIVDYNELKDKSVEELILYGDEIKENIIRIISENKNNDDERINGICGSMYLQMIGIRDIVWYKRKVIKFAMPNENNNKVNNKKEEKSLIKRILKK